MMGAPMRVPMRVLMRADGGTRVGTGHVMRCLALAEELRKRGCECTFAMRATKGHLIDEVRARGHAVVALAAGDDPADEADSQGGATGQTEITAWLARQRDPARQAADAQETLHALTAAQPGGTLQPWDWLVTDHYGLGAAWQTPMRAAARHILAIDDLADRDLDADLLLDQNPQAAGRYAGRVAGRAGEPARQLIGPAYALLRAEFREARQAMQRKSVADRVPAGPQAPGVRAAASGVPAAAPGAQAHAALRVLVSFGGADEHGAALDAVAALDECGFGPGQAVVVAGGRNPHLAALQSACARLGYECLASTGEMARLMAEADLCIGAGGTSMIERFALGLPGIVVPIADNQRPGARAASAQGAIELVDPPPAPSGPGQTQATATLRRQAIAAALRALLARPGRIDRMAQAAAALCDAQGAARVAAALQLHALVFVPANAVDTERLHAWRNHPDNRRHSGDSRVIALSDHRQWFAALLQDPARRIWIAHLGRDAPVGVVRFDTQARPEGLAAVISVYLVPGVSGVPGRGWGRAVIAGGVVQARRAWPGLQCVDAHISPDNEASLRAFAACGFTPGPVPGIHHLLLQRASS